MMFGYQRYMKNVLKVPASVAAAAKLCGGLGGDGGEEGEAGQAGHQHHHSVRGRAGPPSAGGAALRHTRAGTVRLPAASRPALQPSESATLLCTRRLTTLHCISSDTVYTWSRLECSGEAVATGATTDISP